MPARNPGQFYQKVAIRTASPGQMVLMLYDGAIRFLGQSLEGFNFDDPLDFNRTVNNNVLRAQDIIRELNATLNMEQGGEIAENFRKLYNYFDRRLQEGNVKKAKEPIEEIIGRLKVLRDSWSEMLQGGPDGQAAAAARLQAA
jgi:flagellar secretion chaperone FliS